MEINSESLKDILQLNGLTNEQKQIVFCEDSPILVSASAGSGKTFALCCRILFKLLNPKNKITLQNLLVVSFTKAAADEIFSRLKNRLNSLIQKWPYEPYFKKQLNCLSQNNVTTIDSFCSNFLKNNFETAKISPNFKIGNEMEIYEMKQNCLNSILSNEKRNNLENFQKLSDYFSLKSSDGLKTAILKMFEKSRTNSFPEQFLVNLFKPYRTLSPLSENKEITAPVAQEIVDRLCTAKILLENSVHYMDDPVLKKSFQPVFEQNSFSLKQLIDKLQELEYEQFYEYIKKFKLEPLPRYSKKNNFDRDLAEFIKINFLNPAKKLIKSLNQLLVSNEHFINDKKKQKPIVHKLIDLCLAFSKKLNEQKNLNNTFEFSDLLLKTIRLLVESNDPADETGKLKLTQLGEETKNQFSEVLIDEFQDVNKPQELLFKILSNNGKNLFAVGDLKQSIYRFRQADPEIFLEYINNFKDQNKKLIELQNNFRSHCEITNAVNFIFGQIMSKTFGGRDYAQSDTLISSAHFEPSKEHLTEFHILTNCDDPLKKEELTNSTKMEMQHIAHKINNMIQNKFPVVEDGCKKACEPKHFAVLLRSEKQASKILCEELEKLNIAFVVSEKTEFLNAYETNVVVALLKTINNPLDDIAFCALAKSPIFNFKNGELASIKANSAHSSLFLAFCDSNLKKCKNFLKILFDFRRKLQTMSLSQLVQNFYNLNVFNNMFFASNKNGNSILKNLNSFLNLINEMELNDSELNLNKLLKMVEVAKASNLNLSSQTNLELEQQNAVKILTIHRSKGLEFPIVFLPLCAKKFNKQDFTAPIIISNKFGIGLKHSNPAKLTRYNTLQFNCILADEQNEAKAEELRLLYVAMTRAQQKLILVATDDKKSFKSTTLPNSKILPASFCRTKNSFYEWLLSGFMRHKNFHFSKTKLNFEKKEFSCNIIFNNKFEDLIINRLEKKCELNKNIIQNLTKKLETNLNFKIESNELSKIPSKMSISEIAKPKTETFELKKLNFSEEKTTANEIGTAMHTFLQHANLPSAKQNLAQEINRLVAMEFISKKQASCLNLNQLTKFFNSKIFNLIETADSIERERNFIFEIPANKINKNADETPILIQGSIDLVLKHGNKLTIVDYKTNKTTAKKLKLLYQKQLHLYKFAIENLTQNKVDACLIYSLFLDSIVELK